MGIRCQITDRDVNIFLEAIIQSAPFHELYEAQKFTIALLYAVMTPDQRDNFRQARWYIDGIDCLIRELDGCDEPTDRVTERVHELINQPIDITD